jgi:hypothetical protein
MYVIKRTDQGGGYLAPPPMNGYTKYLERARIFPTKEAADAECCPENEVAVPVAHLLQGAR